MELFSNDIHALRAKAREEVTSFHLESDEKIVVLFSEFPSIKGFPFAIVLLENANGQIRSMLRQWDT